MRLERRRRSRWLGVTFWCRSRVRASRTGFAAAMAEATPFLPGLSPVSAKSLTATRDAGNLSSNGGLVVLREAARRLDLAAVIADPLPDRRNPLLVTHSCRAMVAGSRGSRTSKASDLHRSVGTRGSCEAGRSDLADSIRHSP